MSVSATWELLLSSVRQSISVFCSFVGSDTAVRRSPVKPGCTQEVFAASFDTSPVGSLSMATDLQTIPSSSEVYVLADQLVAEMRRRWEVGECPLTEEFVALHPELLNHPGTVGELIYEEVSLRREKGESGGSSEVVRRFPQWATQLRLMLNLHDSLDADGQVAFPEVGDDVAIHLLLELGAVRGARFTWPDKQHSPTGWSGEAHVTRERRALVTRLQHTHIVPLYASHDDRHVAFAFCACHFLGATVAHALARLARVPPHEHSGRIVARDHVGARQRHGIADRKPLPARWATADYVRLIVHLGACLADALQFAHERDLLHMDVKPSNVLLTADGQPMLLDFHLARSLIAAGDPPPSGWAVPRLLRPNSGRPSTLCGWLDNFGCSGRPGRRFRTWRGVVRSAAAACQMGLPECQPTTAK